MINNQKINFTNEVSFNNVNVKHNKIPVTVNTATNSMSIKLNDFVVNDGDTLVVRSQNFALLLYCCKHTDDNVIRGYASTITSMSGTGVSTYYVVTYTYNSSSNVIIVRLLDATFTVVTLTDVMKNYFGNNVEVSKL